MKRAIALMCAGMLSASLCITAFAGDGKKCEEQQGKRLDKMAQELNLTPDQKTKVSAIFQENGEKAKAEMQQMREKHKAMREEMNKKMKEILTPEQLAKFEKMQADRKAEMEKKMKDGKGRHGDENKCESQCKP